MIASLPQLPEATAIIVEHKTKYMSFRKLEDRIEKSGLTNRIRFLGEIPSQDLPALLHGCRALVALPHMRIWLTPLEAILSLPVIASKTGYLKNF